MGRGQWITLTPITKTEGRDLTYLIKFKGLDARMR